MRQLRSLEVALVTLVFLFRLNLMIPLSISVLLVFTEHCLVLPLLFMTLSTGEMKINPIIHLDNTLLLNLITNESYIEW